MLTIGGCEPPMLAYQPMVWTNQSLLLSLTCWAAMGPCAVQP